MGGKRHISPWRTLRRLVAGGAARQVTWLILVALIVGLMARGYAVTQCQANFNLAFARALEQRSDAADFRYQAQVDYLRSLEGLGPTDPRRNDLRRAYLTRLAQADAQRDAAPIPTNPRCG